jgi:predicted transglutaminase-like protease
MKLGIGELFSKMKNLLLIPVRPPKQQSLFLPYKLQYVYYTQDRFCSSYLFRTLKKFRDNEEIKKDRPARKSSSQITLKILEFVLQICGFSINHA